jgi:hypothetical protein
MDHPLPQRRKFHFVDSSTGALSPDAKAHIATENNRQKRLRDVQAYRRQSSSKSPDDAKISPSLSAAKASPDAKATTSSSPTTSASPTSAQNGTTGTSPRKRARAVTSYSPLSLVERSLIDLDPFDTMPAKMNHSAKYLVGEFGRVVRKA